LLHASPICPSHCEDNFKDGLMKAHGAVENLSITRAMAS